MITPFPPWLLAVFIIFGRRCERLKAFAGQDPGADQAPPARGRIIDIGSHLCPEGGAGRDTTDLREIFQALPDLYFQLDSRGAILLLLT